MGRPRKPSSIRLAEGNPGKRPIPREMRNSGQPPPCPQYLGRDEQLLWRTTLAALPLGTIQEVDGAMLEAFVVNVVVARRAYRAIQETGMTVKGSRGQQVRNPIYSIYSEAVGHLHRSGALLGLTPATRARFVAPVEKVPSPMGILLKLLDEQRNAANV